MNTDRTNQISPFIIISKDCTHATSHLNQLPAFLIIYLRTTDETYGISTVDSNLLTINHFSTNEIFLTSLVQVNLAKEDSKSGIYEEELEELLHKVDEMENLHLQGLMLIAPNYEDVEECRPLFKKMYQIFQQAKTWSLNNSEMKYLSMGMTHDYQIAIEEGANIVRVGTAIFGQRQY